MIQAPNRVVPWNEDVGMSPSATGGWRKIPLLVAVASALLAQPVWPALRAEAAAAQPLPGQAMSSDVAAARTDGHAAQPVLVSGAWSRATAPHQDTGVVYLSIAAPAGDTLTGASSPDAAAAMLHQTTRQGAMTGMADMGSLAIPPGGTVRFAPGGDHVMLMGLKHPLKAGGRVRLDLTFTRAGVVHVTAPVQPLGAAGPPG